MKKLISVLVCFCLVICLFLGNAVDSYADPFTAAQIGAAAYAAMSSWGISFAAGTGAGVGISNFMGNEINSYVNSLGTTLVEKFGTALAVDAVGKLAMGYDMYNGIIDFTNWLMQKYDLSGMYEDLVPGFYKGTAIGVDETGSETVDIPSSGCGVIFKFWYVSPAGYSGYENWQAYNGGAGFGWRGGSGKVFPGGYSLRRNGNILVADISSLNRQTGVTGTISFNIATIQSGDITGDLKWNGENFVTPTVIDPSQQWLGQVGDYHDTNLDQLLNHILEDVEGNNLVVVGELSPIDPPQPTPTPIPIDPDMPLQDVPWEGLDNNLQQLYEQGLEEIGTIGDAQEAITDAIGEQTGVLEDALADNAGVVSGAIDQAVSDVGTAIGTQTGVISGAIDQAVSDVQTAIGEQTAALDESLSATAEGVETIAEAIEDEAINWQKFDLKGLFPFCIPFDIYNMLKALDASPVAPHVQIPFVIQSLGFSYLIDLDFSAFDSVAAIMRQMELICYGLALAWATSKVIKW